MKLLRLWIILSFSIPALAAPAASLKKKRRPPPPVPEAHAPLPQAPSSPAPEVRVQSSAAPAPVRVARTRTHSSSVGIGLTTWHETVELKQGSNSAKMYSQLKAAVFAFDLNHLRPHSRWHWVYGIDLGVGSLKGKGTGAITDQFNDQPFLMATARWGLVFRSSTAARAGFFIPASYRQIQWAYDSASTTKAGEAQISAGLGGVFQLRFSPTTSFQATVIRQHMWNANLWAAALNFEL